MPKKKTRKINFLVPVSFLALALFLILAANFTVNSNKNLMAAAVSGKLLPLFNGLKTNNDPLITPASDFFLSFVRAGNPIIAGSGKKVLFFCDFTNPACAPVRQKLMSAREKNNLEIIWKAFPSPLNKFSRLAALAALCGQEQGRFQAMSTLLFENSQELSEKKIMSLADQLDLDLSSFGSCLNSKDMIQLVGQDMADAQNIVIDGVPYLIIAGERVGRDQLDRIDSLLAN
jgi:protein-disulfide isomerase